MLRILRMDQEFQKLFGSQVTGKDQQYLKGYVTLLGQVPFTKRLKLILSLPPQRLHLKGKLLFSYLILFRYRILTSLTD